MNKFTLIKLIDYYNKKNFIRSSLVKKEIYDNLESALKQFQAEEVTFIENKKDISAYEIITLTYQKDKTNYIRYTKTIDTLSKKTVVTKPEDDEEVL